MKNMLKRIVLVFCACVGLFAAQTNASTAQERTRSTTQTSANEDFSFVFMSDVHIRDDDFAIQNFRKAIRQINELQPDFVLSGGDQVFDVLRGDVEKSKALFDLFKKESAAIKAPLYTTVGNHELFGVYPESPTDSTHRYYKYGMYEEYFGKTYKFLDGRASSQVAPLPEDHPGEEPIMAPEVLWCLK